MNRSNSARLLWVVGGVLLLLGLCIVLYDGDVGLLRVSDSEGESPNVQWAPSPSASGEIPTRSTLPSGPRAGEPGALRTIVVVLRYSPHDHLAAPASGSIEYSRVVAGGVDPEVLGVTEIHADGTGQFHTREAGAIQLCIKGEEFEQYTTLLDPSDRAIDEYTLYLTPHPARITVRIASAFTLSNMRVVLQEAPISESVPLLSGQWRGISSIDAEESAEAAFEVFPYASYFGACVLDSGLLATDIVAIENLAAGGEYTLDLLISAEKMAVIPIHVNASSVKLPESASAMLEFRSSTRSVSGGVLRLQLSSGVGRRDLVLPAGTDCQVIYSDGYSAPLRFRLQVDEDKACSITEVLGGTAVVQERAMIINPSEAHILQLTQPFKGESISASGIAQRIDGSPRLFPLQVLERETESVEVLGIGVLTRSIRINGVEYSYEELREQGEAAPVREELDVIIGVYLSESVRGVMLRANPARSSVQYSLEAFSMQGNGERVFVLEGKLPKGVIDWEVIRLPEGQPIAQGGLVIESQGQRIALRCE